MRWLDVITDAMATNLGKPRETVGDRDAWCTAVHGVTRVRRDLVTEQRQKSWSSSLSPRLEQFSLPKADVPSPTSQLPWLLLRGADPCPRHDPVTRLVPCVEHASSAHEAGPARIMFAQKVSRRGLGPRGL